jgi:hypothetical protein
MNPYSTTSLYSRTQAAHKSTTDKAVMDNKFTKYSPVYKILKATGLVSYFDTFIETGFDDADFLLSPNFDVRYPVETTNMKPGHAHRFTAYRKAVLDEAIALGAPALPTILSDSSVKSELGVAAPNPVVDFVSVPNFTPTPTPAAPTLVTTATSIPTASIPATCSRVTGSKRKFAKRPIRKHTCSWCPLPSCHKGFCMSNNLCGTRSESTKLSRLIKEVHDDLDEHLKVLLGVEVTA